MLNKLIIITFLLTCCVQLIVGGCRNQESRECESICTTDHNGALKCEVRGAVILPSIESKIKVEASLEKVSVCFRSDVKNISGNLLERKKYLSVKTFLTLNICTY